MRIREISLVLRQNGCFHLADKKIESVYPGEGFCVMLFLEESQIDVDFGFPVLVLSCKDLEKITSKMRKSDALTCSLLGHGWNNGPRPYVR